MKTYNEYYLSLKKSERLFLEFCEESYEENLEEAFEEDGELLLTALKEDYSGCDDNNEKYIEFLEKFIDEQFEVKEEKISKEELEEREKMERNEI